MSSAAPSLSVVVPVHDAPANLRACLAGLRGSSVPFELILVDDASTDRETLELLEADGARVLHLERNSGPAAARNAGARIAAGEVLVFVDSDVVVHADTLERFGELFGRDHGLSAAFGSYDDRPAAKGLVSEYRNLLHHWTHQRAAGEASTFWAGCGAVRRAAFAEVGGFDESYDRPAIEDIELGMRIAAAGGRIRLDAGIQGTHLKRWRLFDMIRVDVLSRAAPWTRLLVARPRAGPVLNVDRSQQACVALAFLALLLLAGGLAAPRTLGPFAWLVLPCVGTVLWINRDFYRLLLRHGGFAFCLGASALHLLYFVYGGIGYLWGRVTPGRDAAANAPAH